MREFLEDADAHRQDGYGRAQAHVKPQLPKRFYKEAGVKPVEGGFAVALDGKVPRTPGMKHVVVPSEAVAAAMAAEWAAQGEFIDPADHAAGAAGQLGGRGGRARRSRRCATRSSNTPATICCSIAPTRPRSWCGGRRRSGTRRWSSWRGISASSFQPTIGIVHQPQPPATLARLRAALDGEPLFPLTAMNAIMSITGSGLLAIALRHASADAGGGLGRGACRRGPQYRDVGRGGGDHRAPGQTARGVRLGGAAARSAKELNPQKLFGLCTKSAKRRRMLWSCAIRSNLRPTAPSRCPTAS